MTETAAAALDRLTRLVPDFPEPGILFRDLTPVFADAAALAAIASELVAPFAGSYDVIAGVEARGFVLAAASAVASGHGMLMIRKAGKLPGPVLAESYDLEYGSTTLELHPDQLPAGTRVLLLDDVLATGGTLGAACSLVERAGWWVAGIGVLLELGGLDGRAKIAGRDIRAISVV